MRKNFNSVQMLETSEDCKKFSKSVSYETLVGGTATTGTGIKQTRQLFLSSAEKPLTAVGTLTSLLCNSAKVMEKWLRHVITRRTLVRRGYLPEKCTHANEKSLFASVTCFMRLPRRIQRMLLVMTIPVSCRKAHKRRFLFNLIRRSLEKFFKKNFRDDSFTFGFAKVLALALLFTLIATAESWAAKTCDCGTKGHETECCWEITEVNKDGKTEKVLTISPGVDENGNTYTSVQMKNYQYSTESIPGDRIYYSDAPWATKTVTSVKVEGGINNIGQYAFSGEKIKTFYAPEIKEIGRGAFYVATKVEDVYIPKVENIKDNAFSYNYSLKSIELPNVKYIGRNAFEACRKLESVYMPSVETASWSAFWDTKLTSIDMPNVSKIGGSIIGQKLKYIGFSTQKDSEGCLIDDRGERVTKGDSNCVTEISIDDSAFMKNSFLSNCSADGSGCGSCGYDYVMHGLGCVSDCGAGYLGKEGRCIDSALGCGENYRDMGGWCNRIRYTPAEAAEVLKDDNTNEVTITFKK